MVTPRRSAPRNGTLGSGAIKTVYLHVLQPVVVGRADQLALGQPNRLCSAANLVAVAAGRDGDGKADVGLVVGVQSC